MDDICFICGGSSGPSRTSDYRRCQRCGHETLVETRREQFIVNEVLDPARLKKTTALDRFQAAILDRCIGDRTRAHLVDIGSGSGKFLLRHRARFDRATGIEITPECVTFSREVLGLTVVESVEE